LGLLREQGTIRKRETATEKGTLGNREKKIIGKSLGHSEIGRWLDFADGRSGARPRVDRGEEARN